MVVTTVWTSEVEVLVEVAVDSEVEVVDSEEVAVVLTLEETTVTLLKKVMEKTRQLLDLRHQKIPFKPPWRLSKRR